MATITQSELLSKKHKKYKKDGKQLNDDSKKSEKVLHKTINEIILPYAENKIKELFNGKIKHQKNISMYELQEIYQKNGGPEPDEKNKKYSMKPDGGIIIATINNIDYPILIIEDKVQGTNDLRKKIGEKKQPLGNAIERAGKNFRGAEMLFSSDLNIYPYVLFASGCDFHSSETIAQRIEMMNHGYPNNIIELSKNENYDIEEYITKNILPKININKRLNKDVASVFIKTHKWDEMEHGSSKWTSNELSIICCNIIDKVCDKLQIYINK